PPFPNVPDYWFAPGETLPNAPGLNRFVWDLRYPHPQALPYTYFGALVNYTEYTLADHAIPGQTPRNQPQGPLALPGQYTVVLTVGGKQYRQPLAIKLDPRVHASEAGLAAKLDLEKRIGNEMAISFNSFNQIRALLAAVSDMRKRFTTADQPNDSAGAAALLDALDQKLAALAVGTRVDPGFGPVNRDLARLATMLQGADTKPSTSAREAGAESCRALNKVLAGWRQVNNQEM